MDDISAAFLDRMFLKNLELNKIWAFSILDRMIFELCNICFEKLTKY
jgi:hypothetical protein